MASGQMVRCRESTTSLTAEGPWDSDTAAKAQLSFKGRGDSHDSKNGQSHPGPLESN